MKPAIPRRVRLLLRSALASRQYRRSSAVWPINPIAAHPPEWWPGWPHGKKFALVLTHDVEGRKGLYQSGALAELEMRLGFRSSFNFVPEGEYRTPASLRHSLECAGFEVGVHDLHHDGTLYRSQAGFRAAAMRINHHLREWNAVGFRSAFMFHNIEWLKHLDILYDASTFDTDPFEPQSDGANTIFPMWVEKPNGKGFVELPYSLPQDSTLYLILGEKTNTIWKRKLDWVAANGGMALVNVHPDYMRFNGSSGRPDFPAALYGDFLEYAAARYGDTAWCALPREVAEFAKETLMANGGRTGAVTAVAEMTA
jgi:hypothetical protein